MRWSQYTSRRWRYTNLHDMVVIAIGLLRCSRAILSWAWPVSIHNMCLQEFISITVIYFGNIVLLSFLCIYFIKNCSFNCMSKIMYFCVQWSCALKLKILFNFKFYICVIYQYSGSCLQCIILDEDIENSHFDFFPLWRTNKYFKCLVFYVLGHDPGRISEWNVWSHLWIFSVRRHHCFTFSKVLKLFSLNSAPV